VVKLKEKYDPEGFLDEYLDWGNKLYESYLSGREYMVDGYERIAIVGMGGSGIVGDIIRDISYDRFKGLIIPVKDDGLPLHINSEYLVIGVSYSGNTFETLKSVRNAMNRGCKLILVSTGGKMGEMAREMGIDFIEVSESLAPRSGLPQLLGSTLGILSRLLDIRDKAIRGISRALTDDGSKYSIEREFNRAFEVAYDMWGRQPILYADVKYASLLHRGKSSLNENAKINVYYSVFPEAYHNEVEAYEYIQDPIILPVIFMDDEDELMPFINHLEEMRIEHLMINLYGEGHLEKLLRGILLIDVASIYLAYLLRRRPLDTDVINKLKGVRQR